jgi:uncharacterized damage-inducible protein DinB
MNANGFRQYYNYHFSENHKIWNEYIIRLSFKQFTQHVDYSQGSIRNQIVHLMEIEDTWFSELRGLELPGIYEPAETDDRKIIRSLWDAVEQNMRDYLAKLRDDMLFEKPMKGEDKELMVWQVLLHVVNHGTDHRAQILRLLSDLGVKTGPQDYIFYAYDHM